MEAAYIHETLQPLQAVIGEECARMVVPCENGNILVGSYYARMAIQHGILIFQYILSAAFLYNCDQATNAKYKLIDN